MGSYHISSWIKESFFKKTLLFNLHLFLGVFCVFHIGIMKLNGVGILAFDLIPLYRIFALICYWELYFFICRFYDAQSGLLELALNMMLLLILFSLISPFTMLIYSYIVIIWAISCFRTPFFYSLILIVFAFLVLKSWLFLGLIAMTLLGFPWLDKDNKERSI